MVGRGAGREAVSRSASSAQRRHSHCAQFKIGSVRYSNPLVGGAAPATAYTRELRLRELCPRPLARRAAAPRRRASEGWLNQRLGGG